MSKKGVKVVDLFCGCGGFSEGFVEEGYDVLGIDIWDVCLKSHGGNVLQFDLSKINKSDLPKEFRNPTIVIGSPPCQKFSTVNRHSRTKDDSLIKSFRKVVDILKPEYWIWENVMASSCVEKGECLDAQNFGVAQRRKRNFVANFDITEDKMKKYYENKKIIRDVIDCKEYLGLLDGFNSTIYSLDNVCPTIRRIPLKWYDGRPVPELMRFTGFPMLSIEEHLVLMGFPEDYFLHGNKTEKMIQIGNAVSPAVSRAISKRFSDELQI